MKTENHNTDKNVLQDGFFDFNPYEQNLVVLPYDYIPKNGDMCSVRIETHIMFTGEVDEAGQYKFIRSSKTGALDPRLEDLIFLGTAEPCLSKPKKTLMFPRVLDILRKNK